MKERHRKSCDIRSCSKQFHRNQRVFGYARLAVDECEDHQPSYDKECDDFSGVPRENCSAEVEAKQNHERKAEEAKNSPPVDCFDAVEERRIRVFDVKAKEDEAEGETAYGEVDVDLLISKRLAEKLSMRTYSTISRRRGRRRHHRELDLSLQRAPRCLL